MSNKTKGREKLLRLCFAGMFAALIFVATYLIQIPAPLGGYLNLGDCFILIAAWVLGPVYGFAAGGLGSALADIVSGYAVYAPGTFVIKGLIAAAASLIAHAFVKKNEKLRVPGFISGAVAGELIMIAGYYLYDAAVLGFGFIATLANLPSNLIQGAVGAVLGVAISVVIAQTKALKRLFDPYVT